MPSSPADPTADAPCCPKCSGEMWDNRASKRNPKAPDFKCKDRGCDGVVWPPKAQTQAAAQAGGPAPTSDAPPCPKCAGKMWDNRGTPEKPKQNPKAPDFKCRNRGCDGAIWPERAGRGAGGDDGARPQGRGAAPAGTPDDPCCPECDGKMWDNRGTPEKPKQNPRAPDFKCRDRDCAGVVWPPRDRDGVDRDDDARNEARDNGRFGRAADDGFAASGPDDPDDFGYGGDDVGDGGGPDEELPPIEALEAGAAGAAFAAPLDGSLLGRTPTAVAAPIAPPAYDGGAALGTSEVALLEELHTRFLACIDACSASTKPDRQAQTPGFQASAELLERLITERRLPPRRR